MPISILEVIPGSIADKNGILKGEKLLRINDEDIIDEIDYQDLICRSRLHLEIETADGSLKTLYIRKKDWEPLGITLDESIILKPRICKNHCVFCFIDQMPKGMRKTLYVKDDDWRLSLMMGNFVTLTNVDDQEFIRILKRKASPLYISVHATDPQVRINLLRNPSAGNIMQRLHDLGAHGISYHCQIVLCPGLNDGVILEKSINDLASLFPCAMSLAIVPVGLTGHRQGLTEIPPYNRETARKLLQFLKPFQEKFLKQFGTRFVFPSDEFYCLAGESVPEQETYEDFPQIENGVGMLRMFENDIIDAMETLDLPVTVPPRKILIGTGTSAADFITRMCREYAPKGTTVLVKPVINDFFGHSVTVTGLLVGQDLLKQLKGIQCDIIFLCRNMFRENENRFLDDMTVEELSNLLEKPIQITQNSGVGLVKALYGLEEK